MVGSEFRRAALRKCIFAIPVFAILTAGLSLAGDIQGTIDVQRKLTKRRVTASASPYDRGSAVELKKDSAEDDLSFERERVVVSLEGDLPQDGLPAKAEMAQQNRRFFPDTLWIGAGSSVSFPNFDPIFHNVFSLSKPKEFDLGNYPKDHTRAVVFSKPGVVFVNCHLHPNMSAAIVIGPNRWGTKAASDGKFSLIGIPAGTYTIVAWHKNAGFARQRVTVGDRPVRVEFLIPLLAEGVPVAEASRHHE